MMAIKAACKDFWHFINQGTNWSAPHSLFTNVITSNYIHHIHRKAQYQNIPASDRSTLSVLLLRQGSPGRAPQHNTRDIISVFQTTNLNSTPSQTNNHLYSFYLGSSRAPLKHSRYFNIDTFVKLVLICLLYFCYTHKKLVFLHQTQSSTVQRHCSARHVGSLRSDRRDGVDWLGQDSHEKNLICLSQGYRWGAERAGQTKTEAPLHHSLSVEMSWGLSPTSVTNRVH